MFTRLCKGGLTEVHPEAIIGCITVSDQLRTYFPKTKSNIGAYKRFCCVIMEQLEPHLIDSAANNNDT